MKTTTKHIININQMPIANVIGRDEDNILLRS